MSRTSIYPWIIAGSVIALVVALFRLNMPGVTKEGVDEAIRGGVPSGSTKDQVYEFLEANNFEFSGYDAGPDPFVGLPESERQWKRYIIAWVPEDPNPAFST